MSHETGQTEQKILVEDEIAVFAAEVQASLRQDDFQLTTRLLTDNGSIAWFAFTKSQLLAILERLVTEFPTQWAWLHACYRMLTSTSLAYIENPEFLATLNPEQNEQRLMFAMLRMANFRKYGRPIEALEQCHHMQQHLGKMEPILDSRRGWALHTSVQTGTTAMLAGDFTQALTAFTQAQLHPLVPKYAFLRRDALIKSALIHVCWGNTTTAESFLQRAERVPRTSSWFETHLDAQRDFVRVLTHSGSNEESLANLWAISLDSIGEMWPFYILTVYRVLEACGYNDELHHRIEIFESMWFPRVDRIGFTGSVIPLKKALLALKVGDVTAAQQDLDRADPNLPYTQLIQAAAQIYSGQPDQAIQQISVIRTKTRGFRLLELRRLAILASAQYQIGDYPGCLRTLTTAATRPTGLDTTETVFFSPETRKLAADRIPEWPANDTRPSVFLTEIPEPVAVLTSRELEVLRQLALGRTRAEAAKNLFVTVNTLKTQLQSIYRKLNVSSGVDAVAKATQRGLLS